MYNFRYDKAKVLQTFLITRIVVLVIFYLLQIYYIIVFNKFNNSMIAFHNFLNNYR